MENKSKYIGFIKLLSNENSSLMEIQESYENLVIIINHCVFNSNNIESDKWARERRYKILNDLKEARIDENFDQVKRLSQTLIYGAQLIFN